jgi:hypothetical protein
MRPFLLVLIFGSLFASLRAQGSLQFNDVKLFTATSNNTTFTVPANKVWKVETAGVSTSSSAYLSIFVNAQHKQRPRPFPTPPSFVVTGRDGGFLALLNR